MCFDDYGNKFINSDSFRPHPRARPRETEVFDENVRYTFEDENEYDDEDEKENDDEGGSCRGVA